MDSINIIYRYFTELTAEQREKFEALHSLYTEWNAKINVISRSDIENLYSHHVLHSLAIAKYLGENAVEGCRFVDVGTGGGFPGIPLSIIYPEAHFYLIDSVGKKITVVQNIATTLNLSNVTPINGRVENVLGKQVGKIDWIVSRAVTNLPDFIAWIKGKYQKEAIFLKGGEVEQEIELSCKKHKIDSSKFKIYNIRDWYSDEYYTEKRLIALSA